MKAENWNKRTKRKEIQFSDEEYIAVEQKASAARIPVAAYIRQAALDKNLSAALSIEELEIMKRISAISYKMQVNLNQLAKLANTCGLSFILSASRDKSGISQERNLDSGCVSSLEGELEIKLLDRVIIRECSAHCYTGICWRTVCSRGHNSDCNCSEIPFL